MGKEKNVKLSYIYIVCHVCVCLSQLSNVLVHKNVSHPISISFNSINIVILYGREHGSRSNQP